MRHFIDQLEQELVQADERQRERRSRPRPMRWRAPEWFGLAPVAVGIVLALALAAIPVAVILGGGEREGSASVIAPGTYTRPAAPDAPRFERGGWRLRVTEDRYRLESDAYGIAGSYEASDSVARFGSESGYSYLPDRGVGGTTFEPVEGLPDASGQCIGETGVYRVRRTAGGFRFSLVRDACKPRIETLTSGAWVAEPPVDPSGSYSSPYVSGGKAPPGAIDGSRLRLADRRFTLHTEVYGIDGRYRVAGRVVHFVSASGYSYLPNPGPGTDFITEHGGIELPEQGGCRMAGVYRATKLGVELRFELVNDPCVERRRALTAADWTSTETRPDTSR